MDDNVVDNTYRVTTSELKAFVERYERLEAEKKDIADHHQSQDQHQGHAALTGLSVSIHLRFPLVRGRSSPLRC